MKYPQDAWPAPENEAAARARIGNRVTRQVFMDDGTWMREGDDCLPSSPLLHGEIVGTSSAYAAHDMAVVRWDNGDVKQYFWHGLCLQQRSAAA